MIADVLQEEKNKISELLEDILKTMDSLEFMKIPNYLISEKFKEKWDLHLKKFFSDIEHYKKNEFPIVVLGRWNSGKSTLLNAILGEDILPSANREMTSILTKVYYGNKRKVVAQFYDGKYQTISLSEIEEHINFRGSKYSENLKQINIQLDTSLLKSGICILDTPGLGSINEMNNTITFDIIPKADSILLTFSGLDVGGDENLELIEQVFRLNYDNLKNVVLIITKCDLLDKKQLLEAKESLKDLIHVTQEKLGMAFESRVQICMVSSYMELKYKQYMKKSTQAENGSQDGNLKISDVQSLHDNSGFDEFYKILDRSILSSENRKNATNRLFIMIHNILSRLLKDYDKMYKYLKKSNGSSLSEISKMLQHKVNIEEKIRNDGYKEIEEFNNKIKVLQYNEDYNIRKTKEAVNSIYKALCIYIEETSYATLSKNNFADLNDEIIKTSTSVVLDWMKNIKNEFDNELNDTVTKIAVIIEKTVAKWACSLNMKRIR